MTKTEELLQKVRDGKYRITEGLSLQRYVGSINEWVTDTTYRKDVVKKVALILYRESI